MLTPLEKKALAEAIEKIIEARELLNRHSSASTIGDTCRRDTPAGQMWHALDDAEQWVNAVRGE